MTLICAKTNNWSTSEKGKTPIFVAIHRMIKMFWYSK